MILSYDYSRISGYEFSENSKIIILSYDYAQNVRVQRTRQGQRIMLSYDYSRTSGHELSENTKIMHSCRDLLTAPVLSDLDKA